LPKKSTSL